MRRAYQLMLSLYPADYRASFAAEMLSTLLSAAGERGRARFAISEFAGLACGAAYEWIAKLTTDPSVRGRYLPDLRMMRPPGVRREEWFGTSGTRGCSLDTLR
jgi:hypothetical protein